MNNPSIKQTPNEELQKYIDAVVDQKPETAQADDAQRRLNARLDQERSAMGRGISGRRWGWAATAAAAVVVPMMLFMPGTSGGLAFADVQRHFTGFQTMVAQLTTRVGGAELVEMTIQVDDQDRARLDAGSGFTYVIDPNRSMMLQLFHDQSLAMRVPLDGPDTYDETDGLDWLSEIREFQGEAELLDETAEIRGREAYGFNLKLEGMDMTLWAAESGEPLSLKMLAPGGVETRIDFEFDQPLDEALFSLAIPAGYRMPGETGSVDDLD